MGKSVQDSFHLADGTEGSHSLVPSWQRWHHPALPLEKHSPAGRKKKKNVSCGAPGSVVSGTGLLATRGGGKTKALNQTKPLNHFILFAMQLGMEQTRFHLAELFFLTLLFYSYLTRYIQAVRFITTLCVQ